MESNSQLRGRRIESWPDKQVSPFSSFPTPPTRRANVGFAVRPIDERIERLEQLANLGTLSASLAHEIKNAMVAIRTFVEILLNENKNAELAGIVQRELVRIDSIISQMLRSAANPKPSFTRVCLSEVLDRSLRLIEPQLRAHNIRLRRDYVASQDMLQGDAHQLEQAFLNLFLNAFDAVGQNGEIIVTTSLISAEGIGSKRTKRPQRLQALIRDSGIGLGKEQVTRLFEPFYTTKPNGTGLGLPITREIIKQHRGSISIHSEPKKGTVVQIAFPLA
jgi:signal transduction histidine kinase